VDKAKPHRHRKGFHCPHCGYYMDASDNPADPGAVPRKGDVTLCLRCGGLMLYTSRNSVRAATAEEQADILTDPEVSRLQVAIAMTAGRQ
jgi:hypothetical protein